MDYMAEHFENIKPPEEPKIFEVEKSKNGSQILSQSQRQIPEAVMFAKNNDLVQKLKKSDEMIKQQNEQITRLLAQLNMK